MSFGVSVGDFITVGSLIVKLIDTLRNTRSDYQELIRELERHVQSWCNHRPCFSAQHHFPPSRGANFVYSVNQALNQLDKLKGHGDQAIAIDQIKCTALTCREPIEQFLAKIQKYEKSLGLGKSVNRISDAGRKIQYALGKRDEANRLRHYLSLHFGAINTLMLQNSLERLNVASEENRETIDEIQGCSRELKEVKGNAEAQVLAIRENKSMIEKLSRMVNGEIAAPLKTLSQTVAKVW